MTSTHFRFSFNSKNTFCISLRTAEERWAKMVERLAYFGLKATRWNASTPTSLVGRFAGYMNPGQKGCAQSHANIWKYMISERIPYALILEDDACFDYQWLERLDQLVEKVGGPAAWDALVLNCSEPIVPAFEWTIVQEQYLTGGYILSLSFEKVKFPAIFSLVRPVSISDLASSSEPSIQYILSGFVSFACASTQASR